MSITEQHYTTKGEHPEDRIFRDKEYIIRLQKHLYEVYEELERDLRLSGKGKDLLFDYVHNCDEDISFTEYLEGLGYRYSEIAFVRPPKSKYIILK